MDIDRTNFWQKLPSIIDCISLSHAISIDLEMSDIARKNTEKRINPSLRQMYEDARTAAGAFSILQVGLTCISWDEKAGSYVTKTFNIPLSPAIVGGDSLSEELARTLEREIGFSSKTIAFLQQNDFDFTHIFDKGVPYLSNIEASQEDIITFVEKNNFAEAHINVINCPHETQEFYETMRHKIEAWLNARVFQENKSNTLTLKNPYGGRFHRFQKHLVHQLVDTSFYGFRAHFKNGNTEIEINPRNLDKDHKHDARIKAERRLAVAKQTGFRYVWDAICGRTIANKIDADVCSLFVGAIPDPINTLRGQLLECESRLKKNRPIVVGHNMLWDLCFLFKTFNGILPESVEVFQRLVGENLPRIVDTKYLFTRGDHEMMPDQSLMECFTAVDGETNPLVRFEPLYGYTRPALHQAGYDSEFVTQSVFGRPLFLSHTVSQSSNRSPTLHPSRLHYSHRFPQKGLSALSRQAQPRSCPSRGPR